MEHTLAEAARVSISPEVRQELNTPLSFRRKRDLRIELVKQYILSKPYGTRIKGAEFTKLLNMGTHANTYAFINRLVKDGIIAREHLSPKRFFYTVPTPVEVTKPADKMTAPVEEIVADADAAHESTAPKYDPRGKRYQHTSSQIAEMAMNYLWYNPDGGVRDFVKWVESQK